MKTKNIAMQLFMFFYLLGAFSLVSFANDEPVNPGPSRIQCQPWSYPASILCDGEYSGVTRWCELQVYDFNSRDWIEIDSKLEQGCGEGVTGNENDYCVENCF